MNKKMSREEHVELCHNLIIVVPVLLLDDDDSTSL